MICKGCEEIDAKTVTCDKCMSCVCDHHAFIEVKTENQYCGKGCCIMDWRQVEVYVCTSCQIMNELKGKFK